MGQSVLVPRFALVLLVALPACAPLLNTEFGEQALPHQRYLELDSVLGDRIGDRLLVRAQENVGQLRPTTQRPNVVGFGGTLLSLDDGFVHLQRGRGDTVRIGKGSVVRVFEMGSRGRPGRGAAIGVLALGALAYGVIQIADPQDRPSDATQIGVVAGMGAFGALFGAIVGGADRAGRQLYPPLPPDEP